MLLADRALPWTTLSLPPSPANAWHIVRIQPLAERVFIALFGFCFTEGAEQKFSAFSLATYVIRTWKPS